VRGKKTPHPDRIKDLSSAVTTYELAYRKAKGEIEEKKARIIALEAENKELQAIIDRVPAAKIQQIPGAWTKLKEEHG